MKKIVLLFAAVLCSVMLCTGCGKKPAKPTAKPPAVKKQVTEYSAVIVQKDPGGKPECKIRIYAKGDRRRMEYIWPVGGRREIIIHRYDTSEWWCLFPNNKTYADDAILTGDYLETTDWSKIAKENSGKLVGKETINGVSCEKYLYEDNDSTRTLWVSPKIDLAVKLEVRSKSKLSLETDYSWPPSASLNYYRPRAFIYWELSDIKIGHVPDSIFEIPLGYKKVVPPSRINP